MSYTTYSFPNQKDLPTINTFIMGAPRPLIGERVWDTKANAEGYILDKDSSAFVGMVLSIMSNSTAANNGVYRVAPDPDNVNPNENHFKLVKLIETITKDTWRDVYVNGDLKANVDTQGSEETAAVNFESGDGVSVTYKHSGTSTGQSGDSKFFTVNIASEVSSATKIGSVMLNYTERNSENNGNVIGRNYPVKVGKNTGDSTDQRGYVEIGNFGASGNSHKPGLVPDTSSTAGTDKLLSEDGRWKTTENAIGQRGVNLVLKGNGTNSGDRIVDFQQLSLENLSEITDNSTSTGYIKRTATGTSPNIAYSWSFVSESNIDKKTEQVGVSTNSDYPILLKHSNNETDETGSVGFVDTTNIGVTVNPSNGKITSPGFIVRENGSGITARKILVGDGTAIDAPSTTNTFLKATILDNRVSFSWDTTGSSSDVNVDQEFISNPTSDSNNRPIPLTNTDISTTTTINGPVLRDKNFYYNPKNASLSVGNISVGAITASGDITTSTVFDGKLKTTSNQWNSAGSYGIDMQNSDIINTNSIFCKDTSELGEGLHFYRTTNTYDSIRVDQYGFVKFDKGWGYTSGSATGGTTYDVAVSASQTASNITVQTAGTTSNRYYPIQTNPDTGMAVVNVPWSGGGSTVSITVPSPTPTIGISDTTLATVTVNGTSTPIKAKVESMFKNYEMYSFIETGVNTWFRPFEGMCCLFTDIFKDGRSNDIHAFVHAHIRESDATNDGHVPLGLLVLLYGTYLVENNCTTGRFIYETVGDYDFTNYIIADNENSDMWADTNVTTEQLFRDSGIFFVSGNWDLGVLPTDISEYNSANAAQCGYGSLDLYNGKVYYYSQVDTNSIWHKYTFNFKNVSPGKDYADLHDTSYNTIDHIMKGEYNDAASSFNEMFKGDRTYEFFNPSENMIITVEHTSSVGYYTHQYSPE